MKRALATAPGQETLYIDLYESEVTAVNEKRAAEDAELAATAYIDQRLIAYPSIGDQLDALWKELNSRRSSGETLVSESNQLLDQIISVKANYPKP